MVGATAPLVAFGLGRSDPLAGYSTNSKSMGPVRTSVCFGPGPAHLARCGSCMVTRFCPSSHHTAVAHGTGRRVRMAPPSPPQAEGLASSALQPLEHEESRFTAGAGAGGGLKGSRVWVRVCAREH